MHVNMVIHTFSISIAKKKMIFHYLPSLFSANSILVPLQCIAIIHIEDGFCT